LAPASTHGNFRAAALPALFEPPEVIARLIEKIITPIGVQPKIDVALRPSIPAATAGMW
jgi:hypothetical protein